MKIPAKVAVWSSVAISAVCVIVAWNLGFSLAEGMYKPTRAEMLKTVFYEYWDEYGRYGNRISLSDCEIVDAREKGDIEVAYIGTCVPSHDPYLNTVTVLLSATGRVIH